MAVINPKNDIEEVAMELSSRYPNLLIRADNTRTNHLNGTDGHVTITNGGLLSLRLEPERKMRWRLVGNITEDMTVDKVFDNQREVESYLDERFEVSE